MGREDAGGLQRIWLRLSDASARQRSVGRMREEGAQRVFQREFGSPEAIWELDVVDFPAVVTMTRMAISLHEEIFAKSQAALAERL